MLYGADADPSEEFGWDPIVVIITADARLKERPDLLCPFFGHAEAVAWEAKLE